MLKSLLVKPLENKALSLSCLWPALTTSSYPPSLRNTWPCQSSGHVGPTADCVSPKGLWSKNSGHWPFPWPCWRHVGRFSWQDRGKWDHGNPRGELVCYCITNKTSQSLMCGSLEFFPWNPVEEPASHQQHNYSSPCFLSSASFSGCLSSSLLQCCSLLLLHILIPQISNYMFQALD